ncbi:MAG: phosphatidylinositol-specific phospholipase C domain-containing protein [Cyanobacteriota bacterium]|nr:phosphatidylinositol-specific phospholipase C domain-containing protein [Cyanobacteriota bacterium]
MAGLPDRTRLFDVVLPGSHDTGTFAYSSSSLDFLQSTVQTNEYAANYRVQLNNGLRFWDLRLVKSSDAKGENVVIHHGDFYVNTTLNDALAAAQAFLQAHPSEALVISFKKEGPNTEMSTRDFEAADLQAYLDKYATNASLPALDRGLWVAGPNDFARLVASRPGKGLADLNRAASGFTLETRNPRREPGVKLDYGHLTLGDVRGKIVLHMRDFGADYDSWSDSGIVALDGGAYTSGVSMQDDFSGPGYAEKKAAIASFAKQPVEPQRFAWNYTSATLGLQNLLHNPLGYGLTINAGAAKDQYKTDDSEGLLSKSLTPSLKTMLSPGGDLTAWNMQQKRAGSIGLRGTMAGDFFLAPQSFYDDFWNGSYLRGVSAPNLNDAVTYPPSDHLSQLIWRQSALYGVSFNGARIDSVLGIPVYAENSTGTLQFLPYLGNADGQGVRFAVTRVTAEQAGLSSDQAAAIQLAPLEAPVAVQVQATNRATHKQVRFASETQTLSGTVQTVDPRINFSILGSADVAGYRFFRLEFLDPADNSVIGAPSFFAVNDL